MGELTTIISIENNLVCNAHCNFCIRDLITRPKDTFSVELANIVASQIRPETLIILNGWNEPTATDNFEELLDIFSPFSIRFYTNGSLLHKRNIFNAIDEVSSSIEGIYISFNGDCKETYERIMGIPFERTVENVRTLIALSDNKFPINIVSNQPEGECLDKVRIESLLPGATSYSIVYPWDVRSLKNQTNVIDKIKYCRRLDFYMSITVDGNVQGCCNDINCEKIFGNIQKESLRDIWLGEKAEKFRELHRTVKRSEIALCKGCFE